MFGFKKRKKKKEEAAKKAATPVVKEEVKVEVAKKEETKPEVAKKETAPVAVESTEEAPKRTRKQINHITKHKDGGWQIKKEGSTRAQKKFATQKEAIEFAKGLETTTGISYIIHKANGSTRKKKY